MFNSFTFFLLLTKIVYVVFVYAFFSSFVFTRVCLFLCQKFFCIIFSCLFDESKKRFFYFFLSEFSKVIKNCCFYKIEFTFNLIIFFPFFFFSFHGWVYIAASFWGSHNDILCNQFHFLPFFQLFFFKKNSSLFEKEKFDTWRKLFKSMREKNETCFFTLFFPEFLFRVFEMLKISLWVLSKRTFQILWTALIKRERNFYVRLNFFCATLQL